MPNLLLTIKTKIHFQKYSFHINLKKQDKNKHTNVSSSLFISREQTKNYNTIIYYWPKDKSEAEFQLTHLLSFFTINTEIFIVGENVSGVKHALLILKEHVIFKKIDNAKHCILIFGILIKNIKFTLNKHFKIHAWKNFFIKSLPGVFGHKKLDIGSQLLASTFSKKTNGSVLDVGCGSGFLSISLLHYSPYANLTLIDNSIFALTCSKSTLNINKLDGRVILSDVYSNIFEKFDLIISNPPFHEDLKKNFNITKKIIHESIRYLNFNGELRFVANSCYNYSSILKKTFKKCFVIEKTNKYKIYQAFLN